jgi:hypothetical protein
MFKRRKMLKDASLETHLQEHGAQVAAWSLAVLELIAKRLTQMLQLAQVSAVLVAQTQTSTISLVGHPLQELRALVD